MKIYLITGNPNKVRIYDKFMKPNFSVEWFKPKQNIDEIEFFSVKEVVLDKLEKAYAQFDKKNEVLFVTDVGFYIEQFDDKPGAMIKRETQKLGGFEKWCDILDKTKTRNAYIVITIAAKIKGKNFTFEHITKGYVPEKPKYGNHGFGWDIIFVPNHELVEEKYKGKSFAQIPEQIKLKLYRDKAIKEFKQKLKTNF